MVCYICEVLQYRRQVWNCHKLKSYKCMSKKIYTYNDQKVGMGPCKDWNIHRNPDRIRLVETNTYRQQNLTSHKAILR